MLKQFNPSWFNEYYTWLEYSIAKEALYCLCCYLFKLDSKKHQGSGDAFVVEAFNNWKKRDKLQAHIGGLNSTYNRAWNSCQGLMNQQQHLHIIMDKQTK